MLIGIGVLVLLAALWFAFRSWNGGGEELFSNVLDSPLGERSGPAAMQPIIEGIAINQLGYLPQSDKIAVIVTTHQSPLEWELHSVQSGQVVLRGETVVYGTDSDSRDALHHADFSAIRREGMYVLHVGTTPSEPITVDKSLYEQLPEEAMAYFYFHRLGIDLQPEMLADPRHARAALHPKDERITCFEGWCEGTMNARYAWADAGDYGIYPVNHALSAWTLMNLLELDPEAFPDGSLSIPERNNGIPDLLDEVMFGAAYMQGLLLPGDYLVTHKIHDEAWSVFPTPDAAVENRYRRSAQPPSTAATYAVARVSAHIARLLQPYDPAGANAWWETAKEAWSRAERLPQLLYTATIVDAPGGGDFEDDHIADDRYAAVVELYLTALARDDFRLTAYRNAVRISEHYGEVDVFDWKHTAAAGTLSLLTVDNDLPPIELDAMRNRLEERALLILKMLGRQGYPVPLREYAWGSNADVMKRMMLLGHAHALTKDSQYLSAMFRSMDYIMGTNALRMSFVTGYGSVSESDTHDRWAWSKYLEGVPYPRGWLSGGPNSTNINDGATPRDAAAAKSYAARGTAPSAWASKENAIGWNAPLAWASWYLRANRDRLLPN